MGKRTLYDGYDMYTGYGMVEEPFSGSQDARQNYPEGGVSGERPKYSGPRNYNLGPRTGAGQVDDNADATPNWDQEDVKNTGLVMRQPL